MSDFENIWHYKPSEKMLLHILYLTLKVFYSTAQVSTWVNCSIWHNENHFNISFPIWYIFFISVWYLWHWLWPININAHRFLHWLAIWYSSSCISISTYRGMFFVWPRQKHDSYPRKINGPTINDRLSIMRQFEYLIWSTWTHTYQNVATKTSWGLMNEWK